ncbi:MAG: energy transducer TonB [Bacteroidetes bacterium]|nr:energy transducer TonB [Bacteroidota bacterium]
MKNILFILLFILPIVGYSQENSKKDPKSERIYTSVDINPEFPGGEEEFYKYLSKNIKYPKKDRRKGITGRVFLTFVVTDVGGIRDARVLRGVSKAIDEEALRVINSMPKWKPGTQNGTAVNVQFNIPINFTLK